MNRSRVGLVAMVLVAAAAAGVWIRNTEAPGGTEMPGAVEEPATDHRAPAPRAGRVHAEPAGRQASAESPAPTPRAPGPADAVVPGETLTGFVVDDLGARLDGAAITSREDAVGVGAVTAARSRADGTFEIVSVLHGEHWIEASLAGHVTAKTTVEAGTRDVRIVLDREARVRFRLRMPPGSANHVAVWWGFFDERGTQRAEDAVRVRPDELEMDVVAPVAARRMRIDVRDFVRVWRDVQPVAGATSDLGEIAIDGGATIAGRVTRPDGSPPPKVWVHVWDAAKQEILAARFTEDDGSFAVPGIPRAPVLAEFEADGFVPVERRIDATVAGEALAISMVRGALVRVHVLGADGKDPDWCGVDVLDSNRAPTGLKLRSMLMMTLHTGRLPAGRYLLVASRDEGETAERVVDLTEGGGEDITLRFSR